MTMTRTPRRFVSKLRDAHPSHRIETIVCAAAPDGVNPKLFKLERARSEVSAGAFVVVDDDTRLTREGLAALLAALETHTLATGLPCYLDRPRDLPSRLLAEFVNNNAALTYLPLLTFVGAADDQWDDLCDDARQPRRDWRLRSRCAGISPTTLPSRAA